MEVKDAERIVIAKPIASRPSCSSFRSFSDLLAGAINSSPPRACPKTILTAIRPKTVRFKPLVNRSSVEVVSSQGEISGAAVCYSSDKDLSEDSKSPVVYKPLAKLVSRTTASVLANLGNLDISHRQVLAQVPGQVQNTDKANFHVQTTLISNLHERFPSQVGKKQISESSKVVSENLEENERALLSTTSCDRPSYDGYNWRKYGQKQVKGSEYPRSYYKCTYPNCPVKKKVERSLDGQIAEIVYKGEHNHLKPQPPRRTPSGAPVSDEIGQDTSNPLRKNPINERNEVFDGKTEVQNEGVSVYPMHRGKALNPYHHPFPNEAFNNGVGTPDNSCGLSEDCEEGSRGVDIGENEPKYKRRKMENQLNEVSILGEGVQEPRIVVQSSTDSEIQGDGFRWRKYGQKVVKGNPYPRSYYRCTSLKCNVRKHVERTSDDPGSFVTTYEGKHNHDMPVTRNVNPMGSDPNSPAPTKKARI